MVLILQNTFSNALCLFCILYDGYIFTEVCSQLCNWQHIIIGLTHWGRVAYICVNKLTIIGSDNGLLPGGSQAIIWTNAGILLIGPLGTNFSEILIEI